jgi:hypothetical protein
LISSNNIFKYIAIAAAYLNILFIGCKQEDVYPIIPSIEFKRVYLDTDENLPTDTLIGLIFTYRDGDGDIGLNPTDTFPPFNSIRGENNKELNPYHYNLHIEYHTLQEDGTFAPAIIPNSTDTLRFLARMQNLTPEGKHKAIRGDFDWKNFIPPYPLLSRTVKLKVKIYDRALHQSNVLETPPFTLP